MKKARNNQKNNKRLAKQLSVYKNKKGSLQPPDAKHQFADNKK